MGAGEEVELSARTAVLGALSEEGFSDAKVENECATQSNITWKTRNFLMFAPLLIFELSTNKHTYSQGPYLGTSENRFSMNIQTLVWKVFLKIRSNFDDPMANELRFDKRVRDQ